jgi:hypothetical protein
LNMVLMTEFTLRLSIIGCVVASLAYHFRQYHVSTLIEQ